MEETNKKIDIIKKKIDIIKKRKPLSLYNPFTPQTEKIVGIQIMQI